MSGQRTCDRCPTTLSRNNASGLCRSCLAHVLNSDPAIAARRRASIRKNFEDPDFRARHVARVVEANKHPSASAIAGRRANGLKRGAALASDPALQARLADPAMRAANGRKRTDTMLAWCPPEWRDTYRDLKKRGRQAECKSKGTSGNGFGLTLANEVQIWARDYWRSPNAAMAAHGPMNPEYRISRGQQVSLDDQVSTWATPTARMHKGGGEAVTRADGKSRLDMLDWQAEDWAKGVRAFAMTDLSLPDRPTPSGPKSSETRRRLNPLFVEWLMGWPEGLSGFDTAATASCHSPLRSPGCGCIDCWLTTQRAMLSALLTIEPPRQGALL